MEKRFQIYTFVFGATLFLSLILIYMLWSFFSYELRRAEVSAIWIIAVFPPIIASIASTYAAHRYLLHLHQWSKNQDVRKSKVKNDDFHRLAEKDKNDETSVAENEVLMQKESRIE